MILRSLDYLRSMRRDLTDTKRGVTQIINELGIHSGSLRVDESTARVNCLRSAAEPVLSPGAFPWMDKAVYDGRPVSFLGKQLAYFCGQPSYNTGADLVIGVAQWDGSQYRPAERPCIYPTSEQHGIDIPSFCVNDDNIVGVYFDNYGPGRSTDCRHKNLIVCTSADGYEFTKQVIEKPLARFPYPRMGLPWLERINSQMFLTVRSKLPGRNIVSRASFDPHSGQCLDWKHSELSRTTINVASVTDGSRVYVFHGYTVAGGLYVTTLDTDTFTPLADVMVVDETRSPWGWDMRKVCASPWRDGDSLILLYTASNGIGRATLKLTDLHHPRSPAQ